jgi:hypothetical protein
MRLSEEEMIGFIIIWPNWCFLRGDILILPGIEKIKLASELRAKSGVSYKQIGAFLQYKIITTPEKISRKEVMEAEKMIEESKNFLKNTQTWN